jgi:hypothetical protein
MIERAEDADAEAADEEEAESAERNAGGLAASAGGSTSTT